MRWLITGGNGFLGLSVAGYLARNGNSVAGLTRHAPLPDWFRRLDYPNSIEKLAELIRGECPDCIFHAARRPSSNSLQTFNFGSGTWLRVVDLIEILQRLTRVQKPVVRGRSGRHGDPLRWRADNRRLREALPDWCPQSIEGGLVECLATWKADPF